MNRGRHGNPEHSADKNQHERDYVSYKGGACGCAENRRVHRARYQRAEKNAYCSDNPETDSAVRSHNINNYVESQIFKLSSNGCRS